MPASDSDRSNALEAKPLAGDEQDAVPLADQLGIVFEHGLEDFPLADFRVGERPQDRQPGGSADEVERSPQNQRECDGSSRNWPSRPLPAAWPSAGTCRRAIQTRVLPEVSVAAEHSDYPLDLRQGGT
jgi:hypothetical protein